MAAWMQKLSELGVAVEGGGVAEKLQIVQLTLEAADTF
jgi:hypothetical protein